jgi:tripartite-type tricarboxylate transporter receptor subunit TctC
MVHVPYRSAAAVMTDLLSGQVQLYFGTTASSLEYVRTGKLRALAVTIERRLDALPDIPAVAEFVLGYEASGCLASAHRATRRSRSSTSSTRRSKPASPTPR